jgi:hypothetical protein
MSRNIINQVDLNEERRNNFVRDYHQLIEERVQRLDDNKHSKTTNIRHYNRLKNRINEEMMSEQRQIGYVSKVERDNYSTRLIMLDETPKTHFWEKKLMAYDAEDQKLGTTKESRLLKHQSVKFGPILPEKRQTNDDNPIEKKRLKSVVIVPPTTTNNKQLTTEKTKDAVTSPHYLRTFLETTMPKYGFPEYTVPKQNLPPRYTETNPDATYLFKKKS